ncbi:hypothetical protein [Haliangium ochraceum]|uniref:Uncharacterized protein n=1 Tax=Haliangium ochraceum (strain DSM 14365 / JCM 11303 / SMP-2) TaxID=502025 RepID=D0LUT9_HALO1|nr:hypothetical protein [Haliangium ochraceum]ACY13979.1 hypothetical protein Hoch_1425 [Haliangium ochraceum DSM 14365]
MAKKKTDTKKTFLQDLGKATEETKSDGPPERYDNLVFRTKGPYLG